MSQAIGAVRRKIRTRGKAEEVGTRWMAVGAVTFGLGLLLCLTVVLAWLGVSLIVLGIAIILVDIAWLFRVMKHPTEEVACPHCNARNHVLSAEAQFACDHCGRLLERPGHTVPIKPVVTA